MTVARDIPIANELRHRRVPPTLPTGRWLLTWRPPPQAQTEIGRKEAGTGTRAGGPLHLANTTSTAFIANMSHEIRSPLGAVLGFAELLLNPRAKRAAKALYVAAIKRNGELLSHIMNDILDLSKVEAGKLKVEKKAVVLAEVLADVAAILELKAKEKGIILSVGASDLLPTVVATDPQRLRQVLLNIAGNAVKFTNKGVVAIEVTLSHGGDHGSLLNFIIRDSGIGIPRDRIPGLFQPFFQADSSLKQRFGGSGLGLALAKGLACLLGGDVQLLSSVPGEGSTFSVSIDPGDLRSATRRPWREHIMPLAPAPATFQTPASLRGRHILVVEDAPDSRFLITRFLTEAGSKVDAAGNGVEALAKVSQTAFDALVMDLHMPVMDGYEATTELRRRGFTRPIIALTAHVLKEDRQQCLEQGFNAHLSKPVNRQVLLEKLVHLIAAV